MAGNVFEINDASFDKEVIQSDVPVLVDFWAPWCGPCKSIAPILEEISNEFSGKIKIVKVNVDDNKEAAMRYNVRGIPNLVFFKNGESKDQIVGYVAKQEIVNAVNKVIA